MTAQFGDSLPHARQTYSTAHSALLESVGWNARSVVPDYEHYAVFGPLHFHVRPLTSGVPEDVCQGFLENAEQCEFDVGRQALEVRRNIKIYL